MTKEKFSEIDLMKFVDGELEDKELSMNIMGDLLTGDEDLKTRLRVYAETREVLTKKGNTMLLNLIN
jgi:anti-sigma factor RsiW